MLFENKLTAQWAIKLGLPDMRSSNVMTQKVSGKCKQKITF